MVKDWSSLQKEIEKLYCVENKPLREVTRLLKGRHGFHASDRSYRTQLQKWGYLKYSTELHPKPPSKTQNGRPKRRSYAPSADLLPSMSPPSVVSRAAAFQPNVSSFQVFDNGTMDELYHMTYPATGLYPSTGEYLNVNANISAGTLPTPLQYGFGVLEQGIGGKTQLHRATIDGSVDEVRTLLHTGVAVDVWDNNGYQPLHYAVIAGHLDISKLLIQFCGDVNAKGQGGRFPMHLAIPNKQIIELLLQNGAPVSSQDDKGDTVLHLAWSNLFPGSIDIDNSYVDVLLAAKPDVNLNNHGGYSPFHKLLDQELDDVKLEYLAQLLDQGADVGHKLPDGRTPFEVLICRLSVRYTYSPPQRILKTFVAKGADPLTPLPNGLPFFVDLVRKMSSYSSDTTMLHDLCKKVETGPLSPDGNSALHELSIHGYDFYCRSGITIGGLMQLILGRGGDPNVRNRKDQTPLLLMFMTMTWRDTRRRHTKFTMVKVMEKLLAYGADPMLQDESGRCALYEAATMLSEQEMHPLLRAAAERKDPWPDLPHLPSDEQKWWRNWYQATQADYWNEAMNFDLGTPTSSVQLSAYWILAETHLERAKTMFKAADEVALRRGYVADILGDCRTRNIQVDMKYVDYLIALCTSTELGR